MLQLRTGAHAVVPAARRLLSHQAGGQVIRGPRKSPLSLVKIARHIANSTAHSAGPDCLRASAARVRGAGSLGSTNVGQAAAGGRGGSADRHVNLRRRRVAEGTTRHQHPRELIWNHRGATAPSLVGHGAARAGQTSRGLRTSAYLLSGEHSEPFRGGAIACACGEDRQRSGSVHYGWTPPVLAWLVLKEDRLCCVVVLCASTLDATCSCHF